MHRISRFGGRKLEHVLLVRFGAEQLPDQPVALCRIVMHHDHVALQPALDHHGAGTDTIDIAQTTFHKCILGRSQDHLGDTHSLSHFRLANPKGIQAKLIQIILVQECLCLDKGTLNPGHDFIGTPVEIEGASRIQVFCHTGKAVFFDISLNRSGVSRLNDSQMTIGQGLKHSKLAVQAPGEQLDVFLHQVLHCRRRFALWIQRFIHERLVFLSVPFAHEG